MEPLEGTQALDGISLDVGPFAMFGARKLGLGTRNQTRHRTRRITGHQVLRRNWRLTLNYPITVSNHDLLSGPLN